MIEFFFFIKKIKNNSKGKVKKFKIVKLYGAKPKIVIRPRKKGAIYTTNHLLFNNEFKLDLGSFFPHYAFYKNLYL